MKLLDLLGSLLIPGLVLVHLLVAPYTKVEESFNVQATHDILVYGTPTSNINESLRERYDHFTFPGAVPRTFIGPVLIAGISQPIIAFVGFNHAQFVIRAVLGLFNAASLLVLRRNIEKAYGTPTARWFILLQAGQFHVIFYASRLLPNMFAFGLTTLAFAFLLPHPNPKAANPRQRLAVSLFVFAAVVFRAEVALLLATSALYLLVAPRTSLNRLIPPFITSFIAALALSVPVDSYFWQKPLWPELWGFYYNVFQGQSSNWGVSPWHYYFTSALPRLLVNPLIPLVMIPLALLQPATTRAARLLVFPTLLFTAIYSLQPHKEARFIFYVVPPLTAAAALGANFLFSRRTKSPLFALASLALLASAALSLAASTAMLLVSALNYPGGEALAHLRARASRPAASDAAAPVVSVHADVLACMTGVTLFGTATGPAAPVSVFPPGPDDTVGSSSSSTSSSSSSSAVLLLDKTEDPARLADPTFWTRFDYLLLEDPSAARGGEWELVGVAEGFAGLETLRPGSAAGADDSSSEGAPAVGRGAVVAAVRERVRKLTGGWWVGPRMVPRVRILRRLRDTSKGRVAVNV